ncbi:hypothetical protein [Bacillus thuringiensis]|uniref:Uncharacterized protein n=1 Tax=Bacillus thuringiensis subsp. jegathesan TaxID=56955 RepID=A0A9X6M4Q0_BACTJ|nr:hypothetical protein [Bacillus thuringiensis]OUB63551.1 hypothetical protein BK750_20205 [Bacillus thuringiensis serovar jegathesan]
MNKPKLLITTMSVLILLNGCKNIDKDFSGEWNLTTDDKDCPIQYNFKEKTVLDEETKKKKTIQLIDMYTKSNSNEDKYTGIYQNLGGDWISIDYGNNFKQTQEMKVFRSEKMKVFFEGSDKMCSYKR